MKTRISQWLIILLEFIGTAAIIALVTFLLKLGEATLDIQIIALIYLLPVLLCTVLWGLGSGLLAGLLAFIAFNFYFIQPYYTLIIHKTLDVITLLIFLFVAVVMSQIIGQARQGTKLAKMREREATELYELISLLAGITDEQEVANALANKVLQTFHCLQVEVVTKKCTQSAVFQNLDPVSVNPTPDLIIQMTTSRNNEGEIKLWFNSKKMAPADERLLETFSSQGALAIERIHLVRSENVARVLEESDKIKTALLNSVSHELRSPLAAIKASASSLRSGAVDWDSQARVELISMVEEEADHLNLLVGNLLDMSRIEAGALLPQKQWNSIPEIINSAATKFKSQLASHPFELEFDKDLPLVPTDYVMMEQVFINLISNSIKYAPEETKIKISAGIQSSEILIKVINHSPPVPEEHLDHIFDKFFRITKADKVTGTGLGLSICKGIVEAHGGKIWAQNQAEGFSFNILLPLTLDGALPHVPKDEMDG